MFANSHFALATHVLTVLAVNEDRVLTSTQLAGSVNTNPAFLRTLLGRLRAAGLIAVSLGKGGGARLARPAGGKAPIGDAARPTSAAWWAATSSPSSTTWFAMSRPPRCNA